MHKKRLVLVDGNALLHRAFHAMPPLSTSKGELVNAVYGFTVMLLKAWDELKPDYLAAAWDLKAPTFRHVQYEGYKAKRKPADEALSAQYERVFDVLKAFNIPKFSLPGFEADDLVGTLARLAEKKDKSMEIIILTGDRDMMQLIDNQIKVLMPKKTITDVGLYGEEEFIGKYGFDPKNLVDFKALAGDTSDNIVGVPGIGEVTAGKLVQQYQTIENIYKNLKSVPEKTRNLLEKGQESAILSKRLATLETSIPVKLDLAACRVKDFNPQDVKKLFEELEFRSLIVKIPNIHLIADNLQTEATSNSSQDDGSITTKLDQQVDIVLQKMSQTGVLIDVDFLSKFGKQLKAKLADIEKQIYSNIGHQININSPKQLQEVLFNQLRLPVVRKTKTGISTDEETLLQLQDAHPIIRLILTYRSLFKLVSTYVDALPTHVKEDGRIHSTFNVEGAATGRLSSQDPNLQNIPIKGEMGGELRKAFIVPQGKILLGADYSQIELRIMAHLSRDPGLKKAFESGIDIHKATASKIFKTPLDQITPEQRRVGKTMNFATLYGQGPHALSRQLGVDFATARNYIEEYFAQFPKVKDWMVKTVEEAREKGYVETLWGRKRYFPELQSSNRMFQAAGERAAINHPIQGSAADMIKKAMVDIDKGLNQKSKIKNQKCQLILQIHDELLFECSPEYVKEIGKIVKDKMEHSLELSVPVVVDLKVGLNWGEMEPLSLDDPK